MIAQGIDGGELAAVPNTPLEPLAAEDEYRIGIGDVLAVNVWKEPDVSVQTVTVRPDGKISVPLVKEILVRGRTPLQVEEVLTTKFKQFINNPVVTVIAVEIRSQTVSLVGAVRSPGAILMQPGMTVLEAIAEGGGLTEYAKKKKIYVIREVGGRRMTIPYEYAAVMGGDTEKDVALRAGDAVVIPD